MAIRSNSPHPESLLWKHRLSQQHAQLKNEKDMLKAQVKDLSERVAAAEAKVSSITNLKDRVTAIEEDDKEHHEMFARLDSDRSKRLLELEVINETLVKKCRGLGEEVKDLLEERDERGEKSAVEALMAARLAKVEADLPTLIDLCMGMRTDLNTVHESTTRENAGVRSAIRALDEKVNILAAKPAVVTTTIIEGQQKRAVQERINALPGIAQQPAQQQLEESTEAKSKVKTRRAKAQRTPRRPVAKLKIDESERVSNERTGHAAAKESRQRRGQRVSERTAIQRTRTTRHGHTGEDVSREDDTTQYNYPQYELSSVQNVEKDEKVVSTKGARSGARPNRKRPRINDDEDNEAFLADSKSTQQPKRAKPSQSAKLASTARPDLITKSTQTAARMFLNLKQPATPAARRLSTPAGTRSEQVPVLKVAHISVPAVPAGITMAQASKLTNHLPNALVASNKQATAQRPTSKPPRRRPIRMPNLPPTPPPPSP